MDWSAALVATSSRAPARPTAAERWCARSRRTRASTASVPSTWSS